MNCVEFGIDNKIYWSRTSIGKVLISAVVLLVVIMIQFGRFWVMISNNCILCNNIFVEINSKYNVAKCYKYVSGGGGVFLSLGIWSTYIIINTFTIIKFQNEIVRFMIVVILSRFQFILFRFVFVDLC